MTGLLLAAVLLYALNLRSPITALAPVVDDVTTDLALTATTVGLLTGLPVLCFALATPAVSALVARLGIEQVVTISFLGLIGGIVLRSVGDVGAAFAGTVVIGLAITAGNVAMPLVIHRDFRSAAGTVTGLYTAALNLGSVLTTSLTAPLAAQVGWRWALASWVVLVPIAWIPWSIASRRRRRAHGGTTRPGPSATAGPEPAGGPDLAADADPAPDTGPGTAHAAAHDAPDEPPEIGALRRPVTWLLTAAFAGQAFCYYAISAWLPSILADGVGLGASGAGAAASLFQLLAIAGALGVPAVISRGVPMRAVFAAVAACWLTLPVGLLAAPDLWPLWASLAGVAQGANFVVVFTTVVRRAGSPAPRARCRGRSRPWATPAPHSAPARSAPSMTRRTAGRHRCRSSSPSSAS
ncbi:hypothetical protein GCM10025865_20190 [Paraoerskovia sediminicola]|uniref:MFS transporter, CP family, cyanate transporter n=1 Tax=Paraoerskovia sediminicola TaxID=1138587 RepID=A0ABN6XFZ8_9CELL|nr:MFS transporter [Paraoerskovia sediminicola]BDZ42720.1 hypothetical protein GCM10025865_20190 [Paraoerskovia sediminicola]